MKTIQKRIVWVVLLIATGILTVISVQSQVESNAKCTIRPPAYFNHCNRDTGIGICDYVVYVSVFDCTTASRSTCTNNYGGGTYTEQTCPCTITYGAAWGCPQDVTKYGPAAPAHICVSPCP